MYSPRFMLLNLPMKATDRRFAENAEGQSLLHHYSPPPSWGLHVGLRLRAQVPAESQQYILYSVTLYSWKLQ